MKRSDIEMKNSQQKVLHILPHIGGGVGSVIRALLKEEVEQAGRPYSCSVATLETINDTSKTCFNALGIQWTERATNENIRSLARDVDIVLVHWWNHPLLMKLLFEGFPPSRLALWSHVNGFNVPQSFFPELFGISDIFVFATKASFDAPVVKRLSGEIKKGKLRVIRSCAGIPADAVKPYDKDGPFQFGYIGTVESAKMHPDFLNLCASAKISIPCIVAGGPDHDKLRSQADHLGVANQFEILGPVNDPGPIFRRLHVLAYPLNPAHYGTGEQVLVEAMAYGAVPVVFANPPEKALIRHGETGLIANTAEEFANALRFLAENSSERERLAVAGRRFVLDECDIKVRVSDFHALYEEILAFPKCS
ncbi:glycosyltransferase family 4 protein, partial [Patescibacteria group bacterium]|nr:glycosyltransferase family 4 protein [Patescibacteria group bacterium]